MLRYMNGFSVGIALAGLVLAPSAGFVIGLGLAVISIIILEARDA